MCRRDSACLSLFPVVAPSLRDADLFKEDDLGGSTESDASSVLFFVLLDLLSASEGRFTLDEDADGRVSFTTGSFGALTLTLIGTGTVFDRLFEVECAN